MIHWTIVFVSIVISIFVILYKLHNDSKIKNTSLNKKTNDNTISSIINNKELNFKEGEVLLPRNLFKECTFLTSIPELNNEKCYFFTDNTKTRSKNNV